MSLVMHNGNQSLLWLIIVHIVHETDSEQKYNFTKKKNAS